jgi:hypothetical protein
MQTSGGVQIAEQVLSVAPTAELIDIGAIPHDPLTTWGPTPSACSA